MKVKTLLQNPIKHLSKVIDLSKLKSTVENNDWHLSQSVLDHTLDVFLNIENVYNLNFPFSESLLPYKIQFKDYIGEVVSKNYTRLSLLKCAALFHDIEKPTTMNINNNGITSCPNHALLSSLKFMSIARDFDLDNIEEDYIINLIEKHHTPDNFIDYIYGSDYFIKRDIFMNENKSFSLDLLVFYLADFEGCNVNQRIAQTKAIIYPAANECIRNILSKHIRNN